MSTAMSSMFRLGDWRTSWSRTSGDASRLSAWIGRVEKKTRSGRQADRDAGLGQLLENPARATGRRAGQPVVADRLAVAGDLDPAQRGRRHLADGDLAVADRQPDRPFTQGQPIQGRGLPPRHGDCRERDREEREGRRGRSASRETRGGVSPVFDDSEREFAVALRVFAGEQTLASSGSCSRLVCRIFPRIPLARPGRAAEAAARPPRPSGFRRATDRPSGPSSGPTQAARSQLELPVVPMRVDSGLTIELVVVSKPLGEGDRVGPLDRTRWRRGSGSASRSLGRVVRRRW